MQTIPHKKRQELLDTLDKAVEMLKPICDNADPEQLGYGLSIALLQAYNSTVKAYIVTANTAVMLGELEQGGAL